MVQTPADSFDTLVEDISKLALEPVLGHSMRKYFQFEDGWINLNQGSFGTHPTAVRAALTAFQTASERRPDEFVRTTYPVLLDKSRLALANLLHAPVSEIVFVPNATTGIGTVLRALSFVPGDRIVHFDFIYGACSHAVTYITETTPATRVRIAAPFPISDDALVALLRTAIEREQRAGARVRVALFDSIISMPGLRLPFERLVRVCRELDVLSLVDAAHGVGHIPLDLTALDADFLVSNCHKWLFVPRACAVLHVPLRNQHLIRSTLPTSHGFVPRDSTASPPLPPGKSAFVSMFEFTGTADLSPALCIPAALRFREQVCGGEARIMAYCSALAKAGAALIAARLGTRVLQREGGECALYNVELPITAVQAEHEDTVTAYLMDTFQAEFDTAVPVVFYGGGWWARVSGQVYLELSDFEFAAEMLAVMCRRVGEGAYL